jgi:hypothetical protein
MQRPSDLGGGYASPNATSLILTRMGDRLATAGPAAHFGRNESHVIYGTGY